MKKVVKFTGFCAALLILIAFILQLSTKAVTFSDSILGLTLSGSLSGVEGTFGKSADEIKATWSAIVAFVLLILVFLTFVCTTLLPLLKVKVSDKILAICNCAAVVLAIVAAIFLFIEVPCFLKANDIDTKDGFSLGAGWIVAGILSILGGLVGAISPVFALIGHKK